MSNEIYSQAAQQAELQAGTIIRLEDNEFATIVDVPGDGSCFFHVIARFLAIHGSNPSITATHVRQTVATFVKTLLTQTKIDWKLVDDEALRELHSIQELHTWGSTQTLTVCSYLYGFSALCYSPTGKVPQKCTFPQRAKTSALSSIKDILLDIGDLMTVLDYTYIEKISIPCRIYHTSMHMPFWLQNSKANHFMYLQVHSALAAISPPPSISPISVLVHWKLPIHNGYAYHESQLFEREAGIPSFFPLQDTLPVSKDEIAYYGVSTSALTRMACVARIQSKIIWLCVSLNGKDISTILPLHRKPIGISLPITNTWKIQGPGKIAWKYSSLRGQRRIYQHQSHWTYLLYVIPPPPSSWKNSLLHWILYMGIHREGEYRLLHPLTRCYRYQIQGMNIPIVDIHRIGPDVISLQTSTITLPWKITSTWTHYQSNVSPSTANLFQSIIPTYTLPVLMEWYSIHLESSDIPQKYTIEVIPLHYPCERHHALYQKRWEHIHSSMQHKHGLTWEERWGVLPIYTPDGSKTTIEPPLQWDDQQLTKWLFADIHARAFPYQLWKSPRYTIRDQIFQALIPWFKNVCQIVPIGGMNAPPGPWKRLDTFSMIWQRGPTSLHLVLQCMVLQIMQFLYHIGLFTDCEMLRRVIFH